VANCHAKIVALCVKSIFIIYYKREEPADGSLELYGFSIFISARENSGKDGASCKMNIYSDRLKITCAASSW
jgi:hypothetical protein